MTRRRLVLTRETLTPLASDEMSSVAGAISDRHPLCETNLCHVTSLQWSWCADTTCGIACTYNGCYPTDTCS